jgi:hypothetical protein
MFWFTSANYILMQITRALYSTILDNEKLAIEKKKVFHDFPHGVIIDPFNSKNTESKIFTNQEFESKIVKIDQDLGVLCSKKYQS